MRVRGTNRAQSRCKVYVAYGIFNVVLTIGSSRTHFISRAHEAHLSDRYKS